ncbi:restriction endonuclease subunit S [Streptomyces sp. NPDC048258]|uniref:restriction endonuclease subunit S n=1 Tax=Streptomyces sp. NPDC048258 TaxID=3365527 RepID=UPI00371EB93F
MTTKRIPGRHKIASPEWLILRLPQEIQEVMAPYLQLYLSSPRFREWITGATSGATGSHTRAKSKQILEQFVPIPPLAEQRRIVESCEDHFSHLDAANASLTAAQAKVRVLKKSVLLEVVPESPPESWEAATVEQAGTVDLGRQRHPDWHTGPLMKPYLRVANVYEDRIDTSDVKEMDFSGVFDRYRLEPGDVLLNEGQTPDLVGRPAIYRGYPADAAFQKTLLRFRPRPGVLSEWALLVFRRHLHAKRFKREVRITTNITHLPAVRFKPIEFPIPPLNEQERLVQLARERLDAADRLAAATSHAQVRAAHLRAAILSRAFCGQLVPQDPADEPASVLLDWIRAEREAQGGKAKRGTRRPRKAAEAAPHPAPASTPSPTTAVQQELPL